MATLTFAQLNRIDLNSSDPDTVHITDDNPPITMTFTEPLQIGDEIIVTTSNGAETDYHYFGVSANGEPMFTQTTSGDGVQFF